MEYVAAGDVDAEGVHMLSTGGMLATPSEPQREPREGRTAIVATETGMLHPLRRWRPRTSSSSPPTRPPHCRT
jgi:quinolinate synthase